MCVAYTYNMTNANNEIIINNDGTVTLYLFLSDEWATIYADQLSSHSLSRMTASQRARVARLIKNGKGRQPS